MSEFVIQKEIDEAVNAANDALFNLSNAEEILKSAKNWGIVDILGGGIIVTGIKRGKMSDAQSYLRAAENSLNILNEELRDIGNYFELDSISNDGLAIIDFVFDNVFTDLFTQSKINRSLDQVRRAMAQVEGILDALEEISTQTN